MRITTTVLVATCLIALVSSLPLPDNEALQSEALDRLVMVESDDEAAQRSKRTIGILRQLFPQISKDVNPEAEENQVPQEVNNDQAGSENNEVRVHFEDSANEALEPLAPLDDVEVSDDENRNKRFLSFGGNNAGSGGSGGGSGNFLFDIIRLVAGSGSSGSSGSSGGGAAAAAGGSAGGDSTAKGTDTSQEAVPGPVTRLLVIANRGISNLLQDLILRLAATSERIVNFKARLITSII